MRKMILARAELLIPMPDRGGRLFGVDGEAVDDSLNYYRNLMAAGDLIDAPDETEQSKPKKG